MLLGLCNAKGARWLVVIISGVAVVTVVMSVAVWVGVPRVQVNDGVATTLEMTWEWPVDAADNCVPASCVLCQTLRALGPHRSGALRTLM
jgi:hypothetical protein